MEVHLTVELRLATLVFIIPRKTTVAKTRQLKPKGKKDLAGRGKKYGPCKISYSKPIHELNKSYTNDVFRAFRPVASGIWNELKWRNGDKMDGEVTELLRDVTTFWRHRWKIKSNGSLWKQLGITFCDDSFKQMKRFLIDKHLTYA